MDCSIRISAGLCSLTAHRSFSQLTTSFIGSQCQGIRPALLSALPFVFSEFSLIHCSFIYPIPNFLKIVSFHLIVFPHTFLIQFSRCLFFYPFSGTDVRKHFTVFSYLFLNTLVGTSGLEPPTSRLSGVRSNHLSYAPFLVEMRRIELLTPCLQSRCSPS